MGGAGVGGGWLGELGWLQRKIDIRIRNFLFTFHSKVVIGSVSTLKYLKSPTFNSSEIVMDCCTL